MFFGTAVFRTPWTSGDTPDGSFASAPEPVQMLSMTPAEMEAGTGPYDEECYDETVESENALATEPIRSAPCEPATVEIDPKTTEIRATEVWTCWIALRDGLPPACRADLRCGLTGDSVTGYTAMLDSHPVFRMATAFYPELLASGKNRTDSDMKRLYSSVTNSLLQRAWEQFVLHGLVEESESEFVQTSSEDGAGPFGPVEADAELHSGDVECTARPLRKPPTRTR